MFLKHLPKYLFMKRPDHDERWQKKTFAPPPSYHTTPETRRVNMNIHDTNLLELTEVHHPHCRLGPKLDHSKSTDSEGVEKPFKMTPELYRATEAVRFVYQHLKTEEEYDDVRL